MGHRIFLPIASAFALSACATEEPLPYQEGESTPLPVLLFATEGLTFGALSVPCSSAERKFCVENRSVVPLAITELSVLQDEAEPDFSIASIDGELSVAQLKDKPLEPGARLCFEVTYAPTEPGIDAAELFVRLEGFAEPLTLEIGGTSELMSSRTETFELGGSSKVDFLIVLDNSPSMADLRTEVTGRLRLMFDQIEQNYDYRIAIATGDPNYLGRLLPYNEPVIISRTLPNARQMFLDTLDVAESVSNQVRTFESAFRVLADTPFSSDSFLRPQATLALIFISDRDDDSEGPPDLYSSFFSRVPAERSRFVIALPFVRNGFDSRVCWAPDPPSEIGERYALLSARLFGGTFSICDDFSSALFSIPNWSPMTFVTLSSVVKGGTLKVKLRLQSGEETDPPEWRYDPATRTIQFSDRQPPVGSTLIATYDVDCE